jgi:hypothetical protein
MQQDFGDGFIDNLVLHETVLGGGCKLIPSITHQGKHYFVAEAGRKFHVQYATGNAMCQSGFVVHINGIVEGRCDMGCLANLKQWMVFPLLKQDWI